MPHGVFKPRAKHLAEVLAGRKNGPHDAKAGKHMKRAKANRVFERETREMMKGF